MHPRAIGPSRIRESIAHGNRLPTGSPLAAASARPRSGQPGRVRGGNSRPVG